MVSGTLKVRTARAGAQGGWVIHPLQELAQDRDVAKGNAEGQGGRETPWENEAFTSWVYPTQNGEENSGLLFD